MKCTHCGNETNPATRVSVHGMFDSHLFYPYRGATVDELIENWLAHIADPIPARVGHREVNDMGPTMLCPAIVLSGDRELRRVGDMVSPDDKSRIPKKEEVEKYRSALLDDPDIPRLLAEGHNA